MRLKVPEGIQFSVKQPLMLLGLSTGRFDLINLGTGTRAFKTGGFQHKKAVLVASFLDRFQLLATGGMDCMIKIWESFTKQMLTEIPFPNPVRALCFFRDGGDMLVGDRNDISLIRSTAYHLPKLPYFEQVHLKGPGSKSSNLLETTGAKTRYGHGRNMAIWQRYCLRQHLHRNSQNRPYPEWIRLRRCYWGEDRDVLTIFTNRCRRLSRRHTNKQHRPRNLVFEFQWYHWRIVGRRRRKYEVQNALLRLSKTNSFYQWFLVETGLPILKSMMDLQQKYNKKRADEIVVSTWTYQIVVWWPLLHRTIALIGGKYEEHGTDCMKSKEHEQRGRRQGRKHPHRHEFCIWKSSIRDKFRRQKDR